MLGHKAKHWGGLEGMSGCLAVVVSNLRDSVVMGKGRRNGSMTGSCHGKLNERLYRRKAGMRG
jgi:hypothetical protein